MHHKEKKKQLLDSNVARIVAIYAGFTALWMVFSDRIVGAHFIHIPTLTWLSTAKGLLFTVLTSVLLYRLIARYVQALKNSEAQNLQLTLQLTKALSEQNAVLSAERAHWRAAIKGMAEEVWISDPQGRMSLINLPSPTMMGLAEFKDMTLEEILAEVEILDGEGNSRPSDASPLLLSLSGEVLRGEEIMLHRKTGVRRYRQYSSAPMVGSDGSITGAVAIVRDITDQKLAEEAIRTRERDLARAQAAAHLGNWRWDLSSDTVSWSEELYRIFGVDPATFVPSHAAANALIHPGDRARHAELAQAALTGQEVPPFEICIIRPSGEERVVVASGFEVECDGEGKPLLLFGTVLDITERKRLDEALRRKQALFRALVAASSDVLYRMTADWGEMIQLESRGGLAETVAPERNWADKYIHPDDQAGVMSVIEEAIKTKSTFELEHRVLHADGSLGWTFSRAVPVHDANGEIVEWFGAASDITERKLAEISLAESQALIKAIFDSTSDWIWSVDLVSYRLTSFNQSFEEFFSRRGGQVETGMRPEDLGQSSDFVERWHGFYRRACEDGPFTVDYETADGTKSLLLNFTVLKHEGTPFGVSIFAKDITDRKRMEQELQKSEFFFKESQSAASIGSYTCDFTANSWESSEILDRIFGIAREYDRSFHGWLDLIYQEDRDEVESYVRDQVIGKRLPFDRDYRIVRRSDGEVRWVHGTGRLTCAPSGEVLSMIGTIQDVTNEKRAQEDLVRLNERLRALGEHLQTIQERERLAMARDIHDEIGQQLTIIKLDLEWIERRIPSDGEDLLKRLGEMRTSIQEMTIKVQRTAANLRPPLLDNGGLPAAIEWQVNEFRRRSGIECFVLINEDIDGLDQQVSLAMTRIVQESLTNVARHSGASEAYVSLCMKGSDLILEISDNGCGITQDQLASPRSYGLTGMQERARLCGGELTFNSNTKGGTVVHVTIPLDRGETAA